MSGTDVLDLIDTAPVFDDAAADPAAIAEAVRKFGLTELEKQRDLVHAAEGDDRQLVLSSAAEQLGQLAAAGAIVEEFARASLDAAALKCGLIGAIGARAATKLITAGIKLGKKTPRDLSDIHAHVRREASALKAGRDQRPSFNPSSADDGDDSKPSLAPSASSSFSPASPAPPLGEEGGENETLANDDGGDDDPPDNSDVSEETFRYCAELDQSDVDNGKRLLAYFGRDLLVRQEDDVEAGQILAWTGTHWDLSGGAALAHLIGQKVGNLIKLEAEYIDFYPAEARAVAAGEAAAKELKTIESDSDDARARIEALTELVLAAKKTRASRSRRRADRRKWGVSTKNAGRISNMIKCAAPHLRRPPDAFNADPLKVATLTHTLTFVPIRDDENPEPDGDRPLVDRASGRVQYRLEARRGHDRDDMLTAVIPYAYDPKATCPDFNVFLDLFQPEPEKRRTVQSFAGMSLTAQPVQRVMLHTGTGGNGKSVFLEVLARVFGDGLAVGLPSESVSGQVQNNPSAPTPDIARCYAKRYLRIAELPKDAPLKADTIKKLTGGERWPVRTMYKGYFEFKPTAKPHMSGNDEPKFDGADGGMRRRLVIVKWSVTLPEEKHRDFEEVVSEIVSGGSGILNWLIAGALDFLNSGLMISDDVAATTAAHFSEMDPCQQFIDAHVRADVGGPGVPARDMYQGFLRFVEANGMAKMHETRFGRTMKKKLNRDDSKRVHVYTDVALHDVPQSVDQHGPPPHSEIPPHPGDHEF